MTAHEADDPLTSVAAHRPQLFVRHAGDALAELVRHAPPAFLAAGLGPDRVRLDRIPGRHMNAVGDVADRNFGGWPAWKQRLEDPPAYFTVQAADTETERGPALRQIGHVERLVLRSEERRVGKECR